MGAARNSGVRGMERQFGQRDILLDNEIRSEMKQQPNHCM